MLDAGWLGHVGPKELWGSWGSRIIPKGNWMIKQTLYGQRSKMDMPDIPDRSEIYGPRLAFHFTKSSAILIFIRRESKQLTGPDSQRIPWAMGHNLCPPCMVWIGCKNYIFLVGNCRNCWQHMISHRSWYPWSYTYLISYIYIHIFSISFLENDSIGFPYLASNQTRLGKFFTGNPTKKWNSWGLLRTGRITFIRGVWPWPWICINF